jgi:hypothetical protein
MVRHRRIRPLLAPETVAFLVAVAGYAAHFAFVPAAMSSALFGRWIPTVAKGYLAFKISLVDLTTACILYGVPMAAAPFLLAPVRDTPSWRLARAFAVMTAGATVVFFVQRKGFYYHLIPAVGGMAMIASLLVWEVWWQGPAGGEGALRLSGVVPVLCAVALGALALRDVALGVSLARRGSAAQAPTPFEAVVLARTKPGDPVLCFSIDSFPCQPTLLTLGRRPGSHYHGNHFTVPFFYAGEKKTPPDAPFPYHSPDAMPPEEARYLREMREDIAKLRPPVIFVHDKPSTWKCFASFNFHEYLTRTGFIAGAMRGYRRVGEVGDLAVYVRE